MEEAEKEIMNLIPTGNQLRRSDIESPGQVPMEFQSPKNVEEDPALVRESTVKVGEQVVRQSQPFLRQS